MKKLKVSKKKFNVVEDFKQNCTCVCNKCKCWGNDKKVTANTRQRSYDFTYGKFYERGAGMY